MGHNITTKDYLLKYIIPIIIIPLCTSCFVCYGTVTKVEIQQYNNVKQLDQVQRDINIHKVSISQVRQDIANIRSMLENLEKSFVNLTEDNRDFLKEQRKQTKGLADMSALVAVLIDRTDRSIKLKKTGD